MICTPGDWCNLQVTRLIHSTRPVSGFPVQAEGTRLDASRSVRTLAELWLQLAASHWQGHDIVPYFTKMHVQQAFSNSLTAISGVPLFPIQEMFSKAREGKKKKIFFNNSAERNLAFKLCSTLDVKADCPTN